MGIWDRLGRKRAAPPASDPGATPNVEDAALLIESGNALEDAGDFQQALERYRQAISMVPSLGRAYLNEGNALLLLGDAAAALSSYETAARLQPDYAPAHHNVGNALYRLQQHAEALQAYARAVALKPDFVDALLGMGNAQDSLLHWEQAASTYGRALALDSANAQVHSNLGVALMGLRKWEGAEAAFRQALALRDELAFAAAQVLQCASRACDWQHREADQIRLVQLIKQGHAVPPFAVLALDVNEPLIAMVQRQAAAQYGATLLGSVRSKPANKPATGGVVRPLRIGYLSSDFHDHATMHLLLGVLAAHDRMRFSTYGYACGPVVDLSTQQAAACMSVFRNLHGMAADEATQCIAQDDLDILVDLKGYTEGARLDVLARRPAPLVVNWLGYPGTVGEPQLADYIIGDPIVTPLEDAAQFSETIAQMPHCYQPNDRQRAIGPRPDRATAGLPPSAFVFCSFNHAYKITPAIWRTWCRLLEATPDSVLWLLETGTAAMGRLRDHARTLGVDPDRILFAPQLPATEHLARLQLADLALDSFPIGSHTTGSDALWAGVPLVTQIGHSFVSRVAASLVTAAGLPELVVQDEASYFMLALALAHDRPRLAALRQRLEQGRSSCALFDTMRFTRDLERLYLAMHKQRRAATRLPIQLPALVEPVAA